MSTNAVRALLDEIDALEQECHAGAHAWDAGEDPFAMATCDPSDQYLKGEQISNLWKQVVVMASERTA